MSFTWVFTVSRACKPVLIKEWRSVYHLSRRSSGDTEQGQEFVQMTNVPTSWSSGGTAQSKSGYILTQHPASFHELSLRWRLHNVRVKTPPDLQEHDVTASGNLTGIFTTHEMQRLEDAQKLNGFTGCNHSNKCIYRPLDKESPTCLEKHLTGGFFCINIFNYSLLQAV